MKSNLRLQAVAACLLVAAAGRMHAQSLQSIINIPDNIIESRWETDSEGNRSLNYFNNDYCDYHLFRAGDRPYTLKPGKNTVFTIRKDSNFDSQFKNPSTYWRCRGAFPKDFDIDTPYALPVKDGKETAWKTDRRERFKTMQFRMEEGDTVYVTRYGVACVTPDPRLLLVYHEDRTFAAYLTMEECFISPGETVFPGMAAGIAGPYGVAVSFFFLDENRFESQTRAQGYMYLHYIPAFSTSEGIVRPDEGKTYKAVTDDALVTREMTKREQKKYLKSKGGRKSHKEASAGAAEGSIDISWLGDPVSEKDKAMISRILGHELEYYAGLGLDKDLKLPVYNFINKREAQTFLSEKFGRSVDVRNLSGLYLPREKVAVILGYDEKASEKNISAICHEVSHHLIRAVAAGRIPVWLNEGHARYFDRCTADRKGRISHSLTDSEKGRIRSAFMIGEVNLPEFLDSMYKEFMHDQHTDDGVSYTLAHAVTTVLIDGGHRDLIYALLHMDKDERCSEKIDSLYPGGLSALEDDVRSLVS